MGSSSSGAGADGKGAGAKTMWRWLLLILAVFALWNWLHQRPVHYGPGVQAPDAPLQTVTDAPPFRFGDVRLTPLAGFEIRALLLSREAYHFGREAALSPVDFAVGWGRMSDGAVLKTIDISQSHRFFWWHVQDFPIPRREIETSATNIHLIPADRSVERAIDRLRVGQVVHLRGKLVRADAEDGWHWLSSLTREDTGDGACELLYVESAEGG